VFYRRSWIEIASLILSVCISSLGVCSFHSGCKTSCLFTGPLFAFSVGGDLLEGYSVLLHDSGMILVLLKWVIILICIIL
jgi:hypothetical protein